MGVVGQGLETQVICFAHAAVLISRSCLFQNLHLLSPQGNYVTSSLCIPQTWEINLPLVFDRGVEPLLYALKHVYGVIPESSLRQSPSLAPEHFFPPLEMLQEVYVILNLFGLSRVSAWLQIRFGGARPALPPSSLCDFPYNRSHWLLAHYCDPGMPVLPSCAQLLTCARGVCISRTCPAGGRLRFGAVALPSDEPLSPNCPSASDLVFGGDCGWRTRVWLGAQSESESTECKQRAAVLDLCLAHVQAREVVNVEKNESLLSTPKISLDSVDGGTNRVYDLLPRHKLAPVPPALAVEWFEAHPVLLVARSCEC
jgi:hypothetical protein